MKRILKWGVPVDDQPHEIGGGEVVHVGVQQRKTNEVHVWTLEESPGPVEVMRQVQIFGTFHQFPDTGKPLGSAVTDPFVWHVIELT